MTLTGHGDIVTCVCFSPDGKKIATGSRDETVKVWDMGDTEGTCLFTLTGHGGTVYSVCFSPDGKKLATGSDDETVKVWDGYKPNGVLMGS